MEGALDGVPAIAAVFLFGGASAVGVGHLMCCPQGAAAQGWADRKLMHG